MTIRQETPEQTLDRIKSIIHMFGRYGTLYAEGHTSRERYTMFLLNGLDLSEEDERTCVDPRVRARWEVLQGHARRRLNELSMEMAPARA